MDRAELEKYEYEDHEGISKSDLFLAKHYEELFYMTPKDLAVAINAMDEDELIQFNKTIHRGHGMNVDLMMDKLDEICKYQNLNKIFMEAYSRLSFIDGICSLPDYSDLPYEEKFHKLYATFKYFFEDEGKEGEGKYPDIDKNSYKILFYIYPAFQEHFFKLKKAGIITETQNGLKWNRDKISVAEYFDCLECKQRSRRWVFVEKVFGYKNLSQYLNLHKDRQCEKPSKHFEEIKKLLGIE
jgi:hypothetical protein